MKYKICLIYNYAQHYRSNIFTLMDKELNIDFVFGDSYLDVKKMDYSLLSNFKKEVHNKTLLKPIYYQQDTLKLLLEDYKYYIVLGESICLSTWLILIFSKLFNKKIYLWSHGWYGKESKVRSILKKVFFSLADGVFLYGGYAKKLMLAKGFKNNKLHVIYNSLNYDEQIFYRNNLLPSNTYSDFFQNKCFNLIFVGRLTKVKKLDLLLQAVSGLNKVNKKFNLTLIGEGDELVNLKNLSVDLNIRGDVWFHGASYDEKELSQLIYDADLCVSPGNVGLTAMHCMTYGTPVMTHNNFPFQMPEFEAVVEGETGGFFDYDNLDSLIFLGVISILFS